MTTLPLLALLSPLAFATSGGPVELNILGYDPVDRKVFATSFRESATVLYLPIDGPGDWVLAQSWMQGDHWESTLPERVANLQRRLQPLPEHSLTGLVLTEEIQGVVPCPGQAGEDGCRARQTAVTASLAGRTASWTQLSLGASGAVQAWDLPTGDVLLLYTHMGELYEGGYQTHRGEILRRPPAEVPAKPVR